VIREVKEMVKAEMVFDVISPGLRTEVRLNLADAVASRNRVSSEAIRWESLNLTSSKRQLRIFRER
jgi:hypothetical protein